MVNNKNTEKNRPINPLEDLNENDEFSADSAISSRNIQISPLTKIAKIKPTINEPSVFIYLSMPRTKTSLVRGDFRGIFNIFQIYERYDSAKNAN